MLMQHSLTGRWRAGVDLINVCTFSYRPNWLGPKHFLSPMRSGVTSGAGGGALKEA